MHCGVQELYRQREEGGRQKAEGKSLHPRIPEGAQSKRALEAKPN